jgi:hypothetical protein
MRDLAVAPDEALKIRRLRDRKDERRPHRTAPTPCAPHDAAARRRARSRKARCSAGDRRSPRTGRRSVEDPLTLPLPDIRLASAGWRVKATTGYVLRQATTSNSRGTTRRAGGRRSTRRGWSTRPQARRASGGSARRGTRQRAAWDIVRRVRSFDSKLQRGRDSMRNFVWFCIVTGWACSMSAPRSILQEEGENRWRQERKHERHDDAQKPEAAEPGCHWGLSNVADVRTGEPVPPRRPNLPIRPISPS